MAIVEVKVPQLSESVAEATLLQWKKKPGEAVAMDEILVEIETDKVVLEVPAPAAGVLAQLVKNDGEQLRQRRGDRAGSTPKARRRGAAAGASRRPAARRRAVAAAARPRRRDAAGRVGRRDAGRRQADGRQPARRRLGAPAPARTAA